MKMNNDLKPQTLVEFVSSSRSEKDFYSRINQVFAVLVIELQIRLEDTMKHSFECVRIVDEIDSEYKVLINKINDLPIIDSQPKIDTEIFMEIIKDNFAEIYNQYIYFKKIILN